MHTSAEEPQLIMPSLPNEPCPHCGDTRWRNGAEHGLRACRGCGHVAPFSPLRRRRGAAAYRCQQCEAPLDVANIGRSRRANNTLCEACIDAERKIVARIADAAAATCELGGDALRTPRARRYVRARSLVVFVARQATQLPWWTIGEAIGVGRCGAIWLHHRAMREHEHDASFADDARAIAAAAGVVLEVTPRNSSAVRGAP